MSSRSMRSGCVRVMAVWLLKCFSRGASPLEQQLLHPPPPPPPPAAAAALPRRFATAVPGPNVQTVFDQFIRTGPTVSETSRLLQLAKTPQELEQLLNDRAQLLLEHSAAFTLRLMDRLQRGPKPELAFQVFEWKKRQNNSGLHPREYYKMITLAGKVKKLELANSLYQEMDLRGVPRTSEVQNALLVAHARNSDCPKALALFQEMIDSCNYKPTLVTYNAVISVYSRLRDVSQMERAMRELKNKGFSPSTETFNCLLLGYQRLGMRFKMKMTFKKMKASSCKPTAFTYSTLIRGFASGMSLNEMEATVKEMLKEGFSLRTTDAEVMVVTYNKIRDLEKMEKIVNLIQAKGSHLRLNKLMLRSYAYSGRLAEMDALIAKELQSRENKFSPRLTEAVVRAYLEQSAYQRLDKFLEQAKQAGWNFNRGLYDSLIFLYAEAGCYDKMERSFKQMLASGCQPHLRIFKTLIRAYRKGGQEEAALQVLQSMKLAGYDVPQDLGSLQWGLSNE